MNAGSSSLEPVPFGAVAVGEIAELDEPMQVVVLYTRRWVSGGEHRQGVWRDAVERFGSGKAHQVLGAFEIFLNVVATHATRPLQRHGRQCLCLGQDEAVLAGLVAGAGRRDGPTLRLLSKKLIAPTGFRETIAAAAQLCDALYAMPTSPPMRKAETFH